MENSTSSGGCLNLPPAVCAAIKECHRQLPQQVQNLSVMTTYGVEKKKSNKIPAVQYFVDHQSASHLLLAGLDHSGHWWLRIEEALPSSGVKKMMCLYSNSSSK